jgi:hypothetical protein
VLVWDEEEGSGWFDPLRAVTLREPLSIRALTYELQGQWGTAHARRKFSKGSGGRNHWMITVPWFPAGPAAFVLKVNMRLDNWAFCPMYLELNKKWMNCGGRKMCTDAGEAASSQSEEASGRTRAEAQAQEASGPRSDGLTDVRKLEARLLAASTMLTIIQALADMRRQLWLGAVRHNHPDKNLHDSAFFHEVFTLLQAYKDDGDLEV